MLVIKKLNNNAALCVDDNGNQLIALGKGIGFPKTPYELKDLSLVDKTFYGVNAKYYGLIDEIPEDIMFISSHIVDEAKMTIDKELNPNIVFTLADHIKFAYERYKKNILIKLPFDYDIRQRYPEEMKIAQEAIAYINEKLKITLDPKESYGIALHLVMSQNFTDEEVINESNVINKVTQIIEDCFAISIDKSGFNYSRFASHLSFLLKRQTKNEMISSENGLLFASVIKEYPDTYECVKKIDEYLRKNLGWGLDEEEQLYLILHINRLKSREISQ